MSKKGVVMTVILNLIEHDSHIAATYQKEFNVPAPPRVGELLMLEHTSQWPRVAQVMVALCDKVEDDGRFLVETDTIYVEPDEFEEFRQDSAWCLVGQGFAHGRVLDRQELKRLKALTQRSK